MSVSERGPILSREEWESGWAEWGRYTLQAHTYRYDGELCTTLQASADMGQEDWVSVPDELRHKAGAYALRGYFTWDMVDALREAVEREREIFTYAGQSGDPDDDYVEADAARRMDQYAATADAIERILPPRDMETSAPTP